MILDYNEAIGSDFYCFFIRVKGKYYYAKIS